MSLSSPNLLNFNMTSFRDEMGSDASSECSLWQSVQIRKDSPGNASVLSFPELETRGLGNRYSDQGNIKEKIISPLKKNYDEAEEDTAVLRRAALETEKMGYKLAQEIQHLRARSSRWQAESKDLTQSLMKSQAENKTLNSRLLELENKLRMEEINRKNLEEQLTLEHARVRDLKALTTTSSSNFSNSSTAQFELIKTELEGKVRETELKLNRANDRSNALEKQLSEKDGRLQELERMLGDAESRRLLDRSSLQAEIELAHDREQHASGELIRLQAKLATAERRLQGEMSTAKSPTKDMRLVAEVEEARMQADSEARKRVLAEERVRGLEKQVQTLTLASINNTSVAAPLEQSRREKDLEDRLREAEYRLSRAQSQVREAETQARDLEVRNKEMEYAHVELKTQLQQLELRTDIQNRNVGGKWSVTRVGGDVEAELQFQLQRERETAMRNLLSSAQQKADSTISELQKELDRAREEWRAEREAAEDLRAQLRQQSTTNDFLKNASQQSESKMVELMRYREVSAAREAQAEAQLVELKQMLSREQSLTEMLQHTIATLETSLTEAKGDLAKLSQESHRQRETEQANINKIQRKYSDCKSYCRRLADAIQSYELLLPSIPQAASIPSEIDFLGGNRDVRNSLTTKRSISVPAAGKRVVERNISDNALEPESKYVSRNHYAGEFGTKSIGKTISAEMVHGRTMDNFSDADSSLVDQTEPGNTNSDSYASRMEAKYKGERARSRYLWKKYVESASGEKM